MNTFGLVGNRASDHSVFLKEFTVPELFISQVQQRGTKVAVIQDGRDWTYADLAALVGAIAQILRQSGVSRGDRVGILSGRCVTVVAAQLAVLTLGAAFVPLDPKVGQANNAVADTAKIKVLLCAPSLQEQATSTAPAGCGVIALDPSIRSSTDLAVEPAIRPDDLAYVIFTSGSTGTPKGVMVAHRGVCRLVRGQTYADLGPDQVMLNMSAVCFDASIGEIYSAVLNGGTLVILPDAVPSLDRIAQVISEHNVTIAYITAGLFHIIADQNPQVLLPLQQVFPCGDVLSQPHVQKMRAALPHLRMINGYGPTENTVFTCCFEIDESWDGGPVPIGRGLAHDRLIVLDDEMLAATDGTIGQLAVGGSGIALGYLGRPDLTAKSFVSLPDQDGLFYLTGDLVARDADGVVRFHGRLDRQIKINGQRVELDAIEHALREDRAVKDAVAIATINPDGTKQVTALIVPTDENHRAGCGVDIIKDRLRKNLPEAAIPSRIELRPEFPLSGSGKVDRKQLAKEFDVKVKLKPKAATPSDLGTTIQDVWKEVLNREVLDLGATFFDLGGTSLQMIAVHTALQERLDMKFDIAKLFQAPRVQDLVALLSQQDSTQDRVALQRARMLKRRGRQ